MLNEKILIGEYDNNGYLIDAFWAEEVEVDDILNNYNYYEIIETNDDNWEDIWNNVWDIIKSNRK